jgi:hypothetical protein
LLHDVTLDKEEVKFWTMTNGSPEIRLSKLPLRKAPVAVRVYEPQVASVIWQVNPEPPTVPVMALGVTAFVNPPLQVNVVYVPVVSKVVSMLTTFVAVSVMTTELTVSEPGGGVTTLFTSKPQVPEYVVPDPAVKSNSGASSPATVTVAFAALVPLALVAKRAKTTLSVAVPEPVPDVTGVTLAGVTFAPPISNEVAPVTFQEKVTAPAVARVGVTVKVVMVGEGGVTVTLTLAMVLPKPLVAVRLNVDVPT